MIQANGFKPFRTRSVGGGIYPFFHIRAAGYIFVRLYTFQICEKTF